MNTIASNIYIYRERDRERERVETMKAPTWQKHSTAHDNDP